MRIGYDAKRIFHNNTGLGNYGRDVIRILKKFTTINQFYLYTTSVSSKKRFEDSAEIVVKLPNNLFWKKLSSLWRLGPVASQVKKDKVNLYHGLSGEIPSGLKRKSIPTIVTVHDLIFFSHPHYYSFFDRIIYSLKSKHAAKNADKIIAISEQTKRDVIKYLKAEDSKIEVVYQGCNKAFKQAYNQAEKDAVQKKIWTTQTVYIKCRHTSGTKECITHS
ncbi:glycosyltransferase [Zobellia nedashkovskayae]